jgi:Leucine-rich repeat (LRR) protein
MAKREATVISVTVIAEALGGLAEAPPLSSVSALCLSFRDILQISGLEGLSSLRELRLDNNGITVIEGLSSLSSLEMLGEVGFCGSTGSGTAFGLQ